MQGFLIIWTYVLVLLLEAMKKAWVQVQFISEWIPVMKSEGVGSRKQEKKKMH